MSGEPDRVDVVSFDPGLRLEPLRGKSLRIKVDKGGHYGASISYRFRQQTGQEPEEVYFRYYLRFADDRLPHPLKIRIISFVTLFVTLPGTILDRSIARLVMISEFWERLR